MFMQVIRGKVKDAAALRAADEDWKKNLKPGAKGYLGSTGGVADDGTAILTARFDSEASARANSDRPEQGEWWNNVGSKAFEGNVTFVDCSDVQVMGGGGSDQAGFVQVMFGKADAAKYREMSQQFESQVAEIRPDVMGSITGFTSDGRFVDLTYFTSEAEAREGEKKDLPPDMQESMSEFSQMIEEFVDLRNPWFDSA